MRKLFLSHYENYPHLDHFVLALKELVQIDPVLLENCPKIGGTPPGDLAEHYMKATDGVLFLLTGDTQAGGKKYPSGSVAMELVIGQKLFPVTQRFYMLEVGTTFPSMAEVPTWIRFSWDPSSITKCNTCKD